MRTKTKTRTRLTRRGWLVLALVSWLAAVSLLVLSSYQIYTGQSVGTNGAALVAVPLLGLAWLAVALGGER